MSSSLPGVGLIIRFAVDGASRLPELEIAGAWPGGEPGQYESGGSRLILFGHCLLGTPQIAAAFSAAVESGDLDRTAEWPGAYAAIVTHRGALSAYTDLAGQFPLYYSRCGGELLIGPEPAALAAAHGRSPDPLSAAAHIACPGVLPLWWGRSAHAGVGRVEGGMVLRARPGRVEIEPARLPRPVPGRSLPEGAALLRDALTGAIRARCDGQRVSADFSGGLDSSSLAFLAAETSAAPVASVVYHQPLAPAADLADAVRLASLTPRIGLTVVRGGAHTLPFAGLAGAAAGTGDPLSGATPDAGWPRTAEPAPRILTARRDAARLAAVSGAGARLHLTGEGGDAVLMASPAYLADLARRHAVRTLWRHCGEYGRLRHVAPAALAARAVRLAGTSPGTALRAVAADLAGRAGARAGWDGIVSWWAPSGAASWLTGSLRRQLAELAADQGTARAIPEGAGPAELASFADLRRSGDAQRQLRALGRAHGVAVHAPFLDTAVVRAALSVPAATRADPWSYKPLLQSALAGLVPADVLARRTKGDYSAESYRGARQAMAGLRALLRDSRLADLGVIEPAPVLAALDRMAAGIAVPLGPLNTLLATEIWLRAASRVSGTELPATELPATELPAW